MNDTPTSTPLSTEITALISKVVKRTRLRRSERADIERELTAHFRDGLDSGKSASELLSTFGNARSSAACLRTGAIAKRSPLDRALRTTRIAAGWLIVAGIGMYSVSLGYLWAQAPVISFNPIERLQAMLPKVSEQDRAWPIYKQGLIALADPVERTSAGDMPLNSKLTYSVLVNDGGTVLPNTPLWTDQRKTIIERRGGIDILARAAALPALGYRLDYKPKIEDADIHYYDRAQAAPPEPIAPLYAVLFPYLVDLRQVSLLVVIDALMSLEDGDGSRFVRDISTIIGISHHAEEGQLVISQLVGSSIRSLAFTQIIRAMEWRPDALTDDQLKELSSILRSLPAGDFEAKLEAEQLALQDVVQRTYSDNGSGDGWFNPIYGGPIIKVLKQMSMTESIETSFDSLADTLGAPLSAAAIASRKEILAFSDLMMVKTEEQSKRPIWKQDFSYEAEFEQLFNGDRLTAAKWMPLSLVLPALSRCAVTRRLGESQSIAAQTAIAFTQYRRAHAGAWPTTMDELVPNYLPVMPRDPFTGTPINFQLVEGQPIVWSIGPKDYQRSKVPSKTVGWIWFHGDDKLARWRSTDKGLSPVPR